MTSTGRVTLPIEQGMDGHSEGRFLPYLFPDVFTDGDDPLGEANESLLCARPAIARKPWTASAHSTASTSSSTPVPPTPHSPAAASGLTRIW